MGGRGRKNVELISLWVATIILILKSPELVKVAPDHLLS